MGKMNTSEMNVYVYIHIHDGDFSFELGEEKKTARKHVVSYRYR